MTEENAERNRLPFEPHTKRKKKTKRPPSTSTKSKNSSGSSSSSAGIPKAVSQRMVRRMALFSGIPTALGMSSFLIAYWIVSQDLFELPTSAVFAVSLGLFGLGVIGLSYGLFSTSWDEAHPGSWWGWQEFKTNLSKTIGAWRSQKNQTSEN